MSTNDYIKYMTKTLVKHLEKPREERKQWRKKRKETKRPFMTDWFGMVPLSLSLFLKRKRQR